MEFIAFGAPGRAAKRKAELVALPFRTATHHGAPVALQQSRILRVGKLNLA